MTSANFTVQSSELTAMRATVGTRCYIPVSHISDLPQDAIGDRSSCGIAEPVVSPSFASGWASKPQAHPECTEMDTAKLRSTSPPALASGRGSTSFWSLPA